MSLETELIHLLMVFAVAASVGVFVEKFADVPYTIALLLAGIIISLTNFSFGINLSHDIILLVLLPPLLFEGAATTDFEAFKRDLVPIVTLAIPGLIISVGLLGFAVSYVLGIPPLIALLFAVIILPTDPVSVLALFEEVGAPDRLSILVEGESLINDGVGVVLFATLLGLVTSGTTIDELLQVNELLTVGSEIGVSILGGIIIGGLLGYGVYSIMLNLDEHKTEIVLTLLLTYASFLVAEHYFHVSGVVATVTAGLFIGNRGADYAMSAQTKISIFNTLETSAFIVNTFIFVAIGFTTPLQQILSNWWALIPAILLVLLARATIVYPLSFILNQFHGERISFDEQHVILWGGLHASIPIALVLGLPTSIPFYERIKVMVFGVAAFSLIVQGLTMKPLIESLGIARKSEEEHLYELLIARARAIDSVLESSEFSESMMNSEVYERFKQEYQQEKEQINRAIAELMEENPELRKQEEQMFERQLLMREKSGLRTAELEGRVSADVADRLIEETNVKIEKVESGETTVSSTEEGYKEFWKNQVEDVLGRKAYTDTGEENEKTE